MYTDCLYYLLLGVWSFIFEEFIVICYTYHKICSGLIVMKIFGIELTDEEITDTAKNHFKSFSPLVLENYPAKLKKKAAILAVIKDIFEEGIIYTEKPPSFTFKP